MFLFNQSSRVIFAEDDPKLYLTAVPVLVKSVLFAFLGAGTGPKTICEPFLQVSQPARDRRSGRECADDRKPALCMLSWIRSSRLVRARFQVTQRNRSPKQPCSAVPSLLPYTCLFSDINTLVL